jgi:hypothetical protein
LIIALKRRAVFVTVKGSVARSVAAEVVVQRLAVHDDGALAGHQANARDRRLSAAGPLEVRC